MLIKRDIAVIRPDEIVLLDELKYLLAIYYSLFPGSNSLECNCNLNAENIEIEIENNKCLDCGRPLCIS